MLQGATVFLKKCASCSENDDYTGYRFRIYNHFNCGKSQGNSRSFVNFLTF